MITVEWIDSLVEKRRATGMYSEEELEAYRNELLERYGFNETKEGS